MTTGEKITQLRKKHNMTQEQLADILNVSRQSISKWESDIAYPETEKIIKLSEMFNVTVDYLLKQKNDEGSVNEGDKKGNISFDLARFSFEYKSKKCIMNMPLVHINIGFGRVAKGFFSIGLVSKGVFSLGLVSLGILSFGLLSLGLISLGVFCVGLLACGAISLGIISIGAIAIGVFSIGAIAIGQFSFGALSVGEQVAIGDRAYGKIAVGGKYASGKIFSTYSGIEGKFDYNKHEVIEAIDCNVSNWWNLFKNWIKAFL